MADFNLQAVPRLEKGQVTWALCYKNSSPCPSASSFKAIGFAHTFFAHVQNFHIDIVNDQTGLGIVFAPEPPPQTNDGPLWIQAGPKPITAVIDPHISNISGAGTTALKFSDRNGGQPVDLFYQLNFVATQGANKGQKVTPIDPEIKNGGSTIDVVAAASSILIGLVVVAALATLAYRAFRSSSE